MMIGKLVVCLVIVFIGESNAARKLPNFVVPCHRNDPKVGECILKNVEILRPMFKKGIPEMQIPSFDPLRIPEATLTGGQNFKATFTDIEIYRADEFVVEKLKINLDKFKLELSIKFPSLRIKSHYKVDGRILILQLNGEGPADGNYTNVQASIVANGNYVTKKGRKFIAIGDREINLEIGQPHFKFDKIFGDNEELNEQTNRIINENSKDLIQELKPVVTEIVGQFVVHIVNAIFERFDYDTLFPV